MEKLESLWTSAAGDHFRLSGQLPQKQHESNHWVSGRSSAERKFRGKTMYFRYDESGSSGNVMSVSTLFSAIRYSDDVQYDV